MGIGGKYFHITSFQLIIMGFLAIILLGSLLLMLPIASVKQGSANFADSLFTATSAVCVTGLVVHDTATYWTFFGQLVILLMIQVGGFGIITIAIAISAASGKKIGLMQRSTMQEAISAPQLGGIVRMTTFILKMGLLIELLGAVLLSPVFCRELGIRKGLWYAVFHSVSAFCNAGFDLNGYMSPYTSMTGYADHLLVNLTLMLLIIIGGIGFLTWADICTHKWSLQKYRMQSKVVLTVSALLILLPSFYFYTMEFSSLPLKQRILTSLFQSVTPRTAGFNTIDLTTLSETGRTLLILLMLVGGSPGSTAGGMKTTTVAVLIAASASVFRKKEAPQLFHRRISDTVVRTAATLFFTYIFLCLSTGMIIASLEHVPLLTALFETSSAIGTVGLTLGITPELSLISRFLLITLMFFGRVGCLTLVYAAFSEKKYNHSAKMPQEKITVG
ncbi:MAG: potassium transporter TrkG [Eubacteriales bacterium]|nr:potassium transporter TrkG [Eubacteriales bacterium]